MKNEELQGDHTLRIITTTLALFSLIMGINAQDFPIIKSLAPTSLASRIKTTATPRAASLGDIDGDGVADVAVVHVRWGPDIASFGNIVSGRTGATIRPLVIPTDSSRSFGRVVLNGGDWDGDGLDDLVISDPYFIPSGAVFVHSSSDGRETHRFTGPPTIDGSDEFGADVDLLPDRDGDQLPELLVGAPYADANGMALAGRALIIGSANGATLLSIDGIGHAEGLGLAVATVDDLNFDGLNDVLIASPNRPGSTGALGINVGSGVVFDSQTGGVLQTLDSPDATGSVWDVALIHDVDGVDLANDMMVSWVDPSTPSSISRIAVFNRLGVKIREIEIPPLVGHFIGSVGDVNGDGVNDVAVSRLAPPLQEMIVFSGTDFCELFTYSESASGVLLYEFTAQSPLFTGIEDTNGDGFDEIIFTRAGGEGATIVTVGGRNKYGNGSTLDLDWTRGVVGNSLNGSLHITGGTPGGIFTLALSAASSRIPLGSFDVAIDLNPGQFVTSTQPFDMLGEFTIPTSLDSPALAGTPLFFQAFEAASGGIEASNGLELMFSRNFATPVVERVNPEWVPNGQGAPASIVVEGRCFVPAMQATLNGQALVTTVATDGLSATLAVPSPIPVPLDSQLVLSNPNGRSTSITYNPSISITQVEVPRIVGPALSITGGDAVSVLGRFMFPGSIVSIAGTPVTPTSVEVDRIEFISPPLAAGPTTLSVTSPNGSVATTPIVVVTRPPVITDVSPRSALAGELITVRGKNFSSAASLLLGPFSLIPTSVVQGSDEDTLTYIQPSPLSCDETLVVVNPDGNSSVTVVNPTPNVVAYTTSGPASGSVVSLNGSLETLIGTTVSIGGVVVSPFQVGNFYVFFAPAAPPGPVSIVVSNAIGCSVVLPYTYF